MIHLERHETVYAAFYCEENIWHLAAHPRLGAYHRSVVFISNPDRTCAFWSQRLAKDPRMPVIWDYHVVLLVCEGDGARPLVLDLDSRLDFPVPLEVYLAETFPPRLPIPEMYRPRFRFIDGETYRRVFSSDRSHMRQDDDWLREPPPWPIIGADAASNLDAFIDMESSGVGEVIDLVSLRHAVGVGEDGEKGRNFPWEKANPDRAI